MDQDEKNLGMCCHLLSFLGFTGVPFGNVLGPLVLWLIKRNESAFVDECGREAINFQICMIIYTIIMIPLVFVLIGIVGLILLFILNLVCVIKASVCANEGVLYRYPYTIRFL